MAQQIFIDLTAAPNAPGSTITHVDVTVDGGSTFQRYAYPGTLPASILSAALVGQTVQIAAVNAAGLRAGVSLGKSIAAAVTSIVRRYSRAVGTVVLDLNTLGPTPVGTTTYADGAGFPSNGVTRVANLLTVNVEAVADGVYVIRRVDDTGVRDLALDLGAVSNTFEIINGNLFITSGADDPNSTPYQLTPQDGPFEDQTAQWTWGQVPTLNTAGPTPGLVIYAPTIAIQSGGSGGQATTGTVLVRTQGVRAYRAGATPTTGTQQWLSGGTVLSGTGLTYIVGAEVGPFTVREEDGGPSVGISNAILRAAAPSGITLVYISDIEWSTGTTSGLTRTWANAVPGAGRYLVQFYGRIGANFTVVSATLAGQPCTVPEVGANQAAAPSIGNASTNHMVIFEATVSGAGNFVVTTGSFMPNGGRIRIIRLDGAGAVHAVSAAINNNLAAPWQVTRDVATVTNGAVLAFARSGENSNLFDNSVGFTIRQNVAIGAAERFMYGDAVGVVAATPRQVRIGSLSQASGPDLRTIALSFAPAP